MDEPTVETNQVEDQNAKPHEEDETRYCWVCFGTDEDDMLSPWVKPCNCRGTTRWVHIYCLSRWIDEKQKGNATKLVSCPQCQTNYIIVFPSMGTLGNILENIDALARRASPVLTAGLLVGALYWTSVTYGAVTVLQVVGYKEGFNLLERLDKGVLMLTLPMIPVVLVACRMFRWEDLVLKLIQAKHHRLRKLPLLGLILPLPESDVEDDVYNMVANSQHAMSHTSDPVSVPRILVGALLLPSISSVIGQAFFDSVENTLHRTLLGGLAFVVVKGCLKIYYKTKLYHRKKARQILDYTPENVHKYVTRVDALRRDLTTADFEPRQ